MRTKNEERRMKKVYKIRLKRGDTVVVRAGKYKGKTGTVTATHPSLNKVTVEGVNIVMKHVKPNRQNARGAIVEITKPIWVSKVAIVDPTSKKPSRIGYKFDSGGHKIRIYKKSGKVVPSTTKTMKDKK